MNKIFKNEKGFSAIEIVLVVIISVLIGVVGWLAYDNHHKTTATSSSTTSKSSPTTYTIPITPLGISITVPIALEDLTYAVTNQTPYNGETSVEVGLSTISLTNLDPTNCSASQMPLLSLTRVDGQYPSDATIYNSPGALVKQFPTFYIAYSQNSGVTNCSTSSSSAGTMSENDIGHLINSNDTTVNGITTVGTPTPEFTVQSL